MQPAAVTPIAGRLGQGIARWAAIAQRGPMQRICKLLEI
jgi:hypothetical protein